MTADIAVTESTLAPKLADVGELRTTGEVRVEARPSFHELYESEFEFIWHSLRRLGVGSEDVEDMTHDVFVVVYRKLCDYDSQRPIRPWLFGIAFRVASSFRRSGAARAAKRSAADVEALQASSNGELDVQTIERKTMVERAFMVLSLEKRALLILHELEEVSMPEIAMSLGIPLNTAYSRLRLARAAFGNAIDSITNGSQL